MSIKRDEVFNNAIFVLDSVNSSRLPPPPLSSDLHCGIKKPIQVQILNLTSCFFLLLRYIPPLSQAVAWPCIPVLQHPGSWRGWCWGCCCHKPGWIQRGTPGIDPQHLEFLLCWFITEGKNTSGEGTVPVHRHWDRPGSLCLSMFFPVGLLTALLLEKSFFLHSFLLIWNNFLAFLLHWFIHFQIIPVFSPVPNKFPPFLGVLIKNIKI